MMKCFQSLRSHSEKTRFIDMGLEFLRFLKITNLEAVFESCVRS